MATFPPPRTPPPAKPRARKRLPRGPPPPHTLAVNFGKRGGPLSAPTCAALLQELVKQMLYLRQQIPSVYAELGHALDDVRDP